MNHRYNKQGMQIYPSHILTKGDRLTNKKKRKWVLTEVYCPNGHNLVSSRITFDGKPGILIRTMKNKKTGILGISPFPGDKRVIFQGTKYDKNDVVEMYCPDCNEKLPVYALCTCGGQIITLFLTSGTSYCNCIGICNRYGCANAHLIEKPGEVLQRRLTKIAGSR